jgi:prophage maintenance system killer protein
MALFEALGFRWDRESIPREIPRASAERVIFRFRRMLPEYVWDAGVLEGNPFTFPEVKTLLEGVTVGGRKVSDQEQILNLAESSRYLIDLVKQREFKLDKPTFCALHERVARNEALEWGHFRGEGPETRFTPDVALGARGRHTPLATEPGALRLNATFANGIRALEMEIANPFERATAFFLFGSLQQFFFDGNKRTSRFMMNGVLMMEGIDAISIPAVRATQFNSRMVDFYKSTDATEMMAFVLECHPEIAHIRQLNPGLSVVKDLPEIEYYRLEDSMRGKAPDAPSSEREGRDSTLNRESTPERQTQPLSVEEIQRNARENWKRDYYDKGTKRHEPDPNPSQAKTLENKTNEHDTDAHFDFDSEP